MARVRYLPAAAEDLESIDIYLSEVSPVAAWKTLERIRLKARQLIDMPARGRPRDDLADGIRALPVGRYLLFYRIDGVNIDIVRILHGARNLRALMRGN